MLINSPNASCPTVTMRQTCLEPSQGCAKPSKEISIRGRLKCQLPCCRKSHTQANEQRKARSRDAAILGGGALLGFAMPLCAIADEVSTASTFTPGPVEVGWQIYFGAAAGTFPFIIGAWEFSKRIIIQRRCSVCQGSGLVEKGRFLRKCPECGGFFPWQGWAQFFTGTTDPGNGGVLRQPRGQTSVIYKVPPPPSLEETTDLGDNKEKEKSEAEIEDENVVRPSS